MAEPGHPHEMGVLHNRHPAAGTHEASAKKDQNKKGMPQKTIERVKAGMISNLSLFEHMSF